MSATAVDGFEAASSRGGRPRTDDTQRIVELLAKTGTPWRTPAIAATLKLDVGKVGTALAGLYRSGVVNRCAVDVHIKGDQSRYEYRISAAHGSATKLQPAWGNGGDMGPLTTRGREQRRMIEERRVKATRTSDQPDELRRQIEHRRSEATRIWGAPPPAPAAKPEHPAKPTSPSALPVPAAPAATGEATGANSAPVLLGVDLGAPGGDRTVVWHPPAGADLVEHSDALAEELQRAAATSRPAPAVNQVATPEPRTTPLLTGPDHPLYNAASPIDEDAVIADYARQHPTRPLDSATREYLIEAAHMDQIEQRLHDASARLQAASAEIARLLGATDPADDKALRLGYYSDGTLIVEGLPNCPAIVALPRARSEELIAFVRGMRP